MSYVTIWVHAVWGTKNREPLLQPAIREELCGHILANAASKNIAIDTINGYADHLHCLMRLTADFSIAKQMQLIKGESSFWANKNKLVKGYFEWAIEYYAASVSEGYLDQVRDYINRQEEHHKKVSFADECKAFLRNADSGWG